MSTPQKIFLKTISRPGRATVFCCEPQREIWLTTGASVDNYKSLISVFAPRWRQKQPQQSQSEQENTNIEGQ